MNTLALSELVVLGVVAVWVLCVMLSVWFGAQRGVTVSSALLGLALGPLGVLATLLQTDRLHMRCRICGEKVPKGARFCPHCRRELTPELVEAC